VASSRGLLVIATAQGEAGQLDKESRFVFNYSGGDRACAVSLIMPIRAESYASGALPAPFAMNRPEGWLHRQIVERMAKYEQIDDMKLLSIVAGNHEIAVDRCRQPDWQTDLLRS